MKQYYIYLTTNLINGKKYIGQHYGEIDDCYLGSTNTLKKYIQEKKPYHGYIVQYIEK